MNIARTLRKTPSTLPAILFKRAHSTHSTSIAAMPSQHAKLQELLGRNQKYAETYKPVPSFEQMRAKMVANPTKGLAIISCSDPRVIPQEFLNFSVLEAASIVNAGGRAADAIRTLLVLDSLGKLGTIMVVHHTDCGLTHIDDKGVHAKIHERYPGIEAATADMKFGEITDLNKDLIDDVKLLKSIPAFGSQVEVIGYMLDLKTGLLTEVEA